MRILVVEDDAVIGRALTQGFTEAGHQCDWVQDGEAGTEAALKQQNLTRIPGASLIKFPEAI